MKTDQRDAERLLRLLMIDGLHAVRVPSTEEEVLRDLVRAPAPVAGIRCWRLDKRASIWDGCVVSPESARGSPRLVAQTLEDHSGQPLPDDRLVKPANGAIEIQGKPERVAAASKVLKDERTLDDAEHTLDDAEQALAEVDQTGV